MIKHRYQTRVEIYKADDGWRWRFMAANGKILAASGESYSTKSNCKRSIDKLLSAIWMADYFVEVLKQKK